MGCDIHMFVEKKESWGWSHVYRHVPDEKYGKDKFPAPDRDNYFGWEDRNYALFAKLADVRNGYGGTFTPIAQPRGVPEDASFEVKEWMQDSDYHSASYLTLAELQAADWTVPPDYKWQPFDEFREVTMKRLAELGEPECVRIVFAFDN